MKTIVYAANSRKGGVAILELNREGGALTERGRVLPECGVAPLAAAPGGKFLYAAVRTGDPAVAAFAIDAATGGLRRLNTVSAPAAPAYMTVDATGGFLLCASYHGNVVFVLALGRDGTVLPETACLAHPGRNPHCVVLDSSNRFAYVPTLGSDIIAQYRFDAARGALSPNEPAVVATGREAGPRHLVLRPEAGLAYLLTELSGEIVGYRLDERTGCLVRVHATPVLPLERALPPGTYTPPDNAAGGGNSPTPVTWCADIRMAPGGRFLYASERTGSTVSRFRVGAAEGRLDYAGVMDTETRPRAMAVDSAGGWLFVAGESSNHAAAYALDGTTGEPALTSRVETGDAPTWLEAVTFA